LQVIQTGYEGTEHIHQFKILLLHVFRKHGSKGRSIVKEFTIKCIGHNNGINRAEDPPGLFYYPDMFVSQRHNHNIGLLDNANIHLPAAD